MCELITRLCHRSLTMTQLKHKGFTFEVSHAQNENPYPWETSECYGPVIPWKPNVEPPRGYRLLAGSDRAPIGWYDQHAAQKQASKDNWGLSTNQRELLKERFGREPTKNEIIQRAVELDFLRLQSWAAGHWWYEDIVVTLLDAGKRTTHYTEVLGLVESDCGEHASIAIDLADQIIARLPDGAETKGIVVYLK